MDFISGEDRGQTLLLPDSLEDYVGEDNPVRVTDAFVNGLETHGLGFSGAAPNDTGRPSYDPKDMLKLYVYMYRVRSSRRLETETKRNLEVIWLLGRLSPDHKTISRFRRDNGKALKNTFRAFVGLCADLGLYGKELVAIDGSKFKAVNGRERNFSEKKLRDRIKRMDAKIEEYMKELESNDKAECGADGGKSAAEITEIVRGLTARKEQYQKFAKELAETGETQKSLTDADSRLMKTKDGVEVCYNVQTAVDSKHKLIAEFEVTNRVNDYNQLRPMAAKAADALGTAAFAAVADAGYDSTRDIVGCVRDGFEVHVAGTDFDACVPSDAPGGEITGHKDGRCVYYPERNVALCPMGKVLYPKFYSKSKKRGVFHNNKECKSCACKCTGKTRHRHEVAMAEAAFTKTCDDKNLHVRQVRIKADAAAVGERKSIVEHPFGTIKRAMDSGYCLTKGLANVAGEFSLTFLAYNIKRAISILGCAGLAAAVGRNALASGLAG